MRIDVLADVKTTLGEGPLWDVEEQRLYWIDSFDGRVFRCTADGREIRAWDVPQKIGSMCLRRDERPSRRSSRLSPRCRRCRFRSSLSSDPSPWSRRLRLLPCPLPSRPPAAAASAGASASPLHTRRPP